MTYGESPSSPAFKNGRSFIKWYNLAYQHSLKGPIATNTLPHMTKLMSKFVGYLAEEWLINYQQKDLYLFILTKSVEPMGQSAEPSL